MKTPGKNQKKQGPSDTHGSKASTIEKNKNINQGKGPWKDPDPTNPKKSPEKVNEPYAKTSATATGEKTTKNKPTAEKITNAGESEHHIPVNKSDYETFEDEYEDFELEDEEDDFDEDEDGETDSNYNYEEEEDESKQFRSQVIPPEQRRINEQNRLRKEQNKNKEIENKAKSPLSPNNQRKNNNPQG